MSLVAKQPDAVFFFSHTRRAEILEGRSPVSFGMR